MTSKNDLRNEVLCIDSGLPRNYPVERTDVYERKDIPSMNPEQYDSPLPEDDAIKAAHPTRSGRHDLYAEAMRLVGARHSKAGLVELVTWLLVERDEARHIAEHGECTCSRLNVSEPCDLHEPPWKPRGPVAAVLGTKS